MSRLLVRLPNWLGDAVMASAVVGRVRRKQTRPAVLVLRHWLTPLAEAWGEGLALAPELADAETNPRAWFAAARDARLAGVDSALILTESWRGAAWARAAGLHPIVCFAGAGRAVLGARTVPRPAGHLAEQYGALADAAAVPASVAGPTFEVPESWRTAARQLLGAHASHPFVVLAPGATFGNAKRWPASSFHALAGDLSRSGMRIVVTGTADEAAAGAALCEAAGTGALNLAGRTDLRALGGVCALAHVVVGNDSGVVHLAAAAGTPTVAPYGSTAPAWTAPISPRHRSLTSATPCSPCFQSTCSFGAPCLAQISVRDVARAVHDASATRSSGASSSTVVYSALSSPDSCGVRRE